MKCDGLWDRLCPYILMSPQAPTDGGPHPGAHPRAEFYPSLRMPDRLRYLAGYELGAEVFTAKAVPEDAAKQLQAVAVDVDA